MNESPKRVLVSDPSLRDGNHAVSHQLTADQIAAYCRCADEAGIPIVEVGHGNGLGASSLQVGVARTDDATMIKVARENLRTSRLGVFIIPGFATIERDLKPAIGGGVDVIRVASHCTEADITERHISYCRKEGKTVFGVLMMSHMIEKDALCEEARKMESYGAEAVVLMDSAGASLPADVTTKISYLRERLSIPVGFHAHNNLGMGIANSVAAVQAGAAIVDGCSRGFGAGAGNAQLEVLIAVLDRMGYETGVNLYKVLDLGDLAEECLVKEMPYVRSLSIVSGLSGVFSGFLKHVLRISKKFSVDPRDVFFELGRRKVVAGQEDLILEVATQLAKKEKE
jgi:4-hydroxy 2-oxovalerate aldolase